MYFSQFRKNQIIKRKDYLLNTIGNTININENYLYLGVLNGCVYLMRSGADILRLPIIDDGHWIPHDYEEITNIHNFTENEIITRINPVWYSNKMPDTSWMGTRCKVHIEGTILYVETLSDDSSGAHLDLTKEDHKAFQYGWALYKDPIQHLRINE